MADKKISQLTALSAANLAPSTDVLAIVDTSATETKKIAAQDIVNGVLNVASAVGIGTSSPAYKLDVAGAMQSSVASGNGAVYINNSSLSGKFWTFIPETSSGESNLLLYYGGTGAGTKLTLTNSGNLGLGVTPSAWRSLETALQYGGVGALSSYNSITTNFRNNCFINSSNAEKYIANGYALIYSQNKDTGVHAWLNAASGTAGNAISFTQAMALAADGALLVGTTTSDNGAVYSIEQQEN